MSSRDSVKLQPRNVAAFRRGQAPARVVLTAGNPVSTRLESGVGNCFPGLECDLRNLERRFFPFLEVDILANMDVLRVLGVDLAGVGAAEAAGTLAPAMATEYRRVAQTLPPEPASEATAWTVRTLEGTFGPLGHLVLNLPLSGPSMGPGRRPPDAWTAVRLLSEDTEVRLELARSGEPPARLVGRRARYLDDNGALSDIFLPGELTQSLCSPWTHDFRDCACFYWASNHPDIALPPDPPTGTTDPRWNARVDWERRDRRPGEPPAAMTQDGPPAGSQLAYFEINRDWQKLNFVLEDREHTGPYLQKPGPDATPFPESVLVAQLRYAAGVELAVMHVYLAAAFSLRDPETVANASLADDIAAAHYEIMRIAVGEMRHIRNVRDVLQAMVPAPPFDPPLRIATRVPAVRPGDPPVVLVPSALTPDVLDRFIELEAPNVAVDGLYARILATLAATGNERSQESIRRIVAEGEDHQETFQAMREWLRPHAPASYLRSAALSAPPPGNAAHDALQAAYLRVLERLHAGYGQTTLAGGSSVNAARDTMLSTLHEACQTVARAGFLVVFDRISDVRFAAIDPP